MPKYRIYAGLGGGFGGLVYQETIEANSQEEADDAAFEAACKVYNSYEGMYGIRDISEIMEEEDCGEEDAEGVYNDERDGWLEYSAVLETPENKDDD